MTLKLLVCGTRTLTDYQLVKKHIEKFTRKLKGKFELVTGACPTGADALAEHWAHECWQRISCIKKFHPEWSKGPKAGPLRNTEMIEYLKQHKRVAVLAFWNGKSPGTGDCIGKAQKAKIKTRIITY